MKKQKSVKQEIALIKRKTTREYKAKLFNAVMEKRKIETIGDTAALFGGLSRKAVERKVREAILILSGCGYTPREIYRMLEGKIWEGKK
jgi:hypothetical protein